MGVVSDVAWQWSSSVTTPMIAFPIINATTEGVSPVGALTPYQRVEAETIAFSEGVKSEWNAKTGVYVSGIHDGDYIKVREVDFEDLSPKCLCVSVASALRGGWIEIRTDSIGGTLIAEMRVPHTGGWECWTSIEADVTVPVTGVHDVYFVFKGRKGCELFHFDWWKFSRQEMTEQEVKDRTQAASTNIPGYEYPRLDEEHCAHFRFYAPQAGRLQGRLLR